LLFMFWHGHWNWSRRYGLEVGAEISSIEDLYGIFTIYSIGFVALCLVILLLYLRAWARRDDLELNAAERHVTRSEIGSWLILAGVGLLAVLMGLFAPHHPLTVPGWAYTLLPVVMPLWGVMRGRQHKRLVQGTGKPSSPAKQRGDS